MSAEIGGIAVLGVICFIVFIVLVLYKRGNVARLLVPPIPCFPRLKRKRPMRIKYTCGVVQTLGTKLQKIFDETIYESDVQKEGKKPLRTGVTKELAEAWEKIKENKEKCTIWCLRFNKRWIVAGEKGKVVFMFSLFSPEEMIHPYRQIIRGILLHPPLHVHHPIPKNEWIQMRIEEAKANGRKITPKLRKEIEKSHRLAPKEPWISLILRPTALSVIEEAELVERSVGFENLVKITINAMREISTKFAKFPVYEHIVKNTLERQRQMELIINDLEDDKGHNARDIQLLRHQLKMLTVPLRLSPDREPFPSSIPQVTKEEKGSVKEIKKAINDMDYTEAFLAVMAILGLIFTIVGFFVCIASVAMWPVLAIGIVMSFCGVGLYMWKKRNEPHKEKPAPAKPLEVTNDVEQ